MRVSSPDKLLFPAAAITKAEVVAYYSSAAERVFTHTEGRPLTLQRFPQGIDAKGFMQKNAADHFPNSIERIEIPKADGGSTRYPVLTTAEDIPYLANLNTITFHAWASRLPNLGHIDRLTFDLDPPEGEVETVRHATRLVGDRLRDLGLTSALMTTGSKGFHVVCAVEPTPEDEAGRFAWALAQILAADHPEVLTDEFRIANRKGRVFIDWMRNRPGATSVVAWSLRPRRDAPVAAPIRWDELSDVHPQQWTLRTVAERLAEPDPLAAHCAQPQTLASAAHAVISEADVRGIELGSFDRFRD